MVGDPAAPSAESGAEALHAMELLLFAPAEVPHLRDPPPGAPLPGIFHRGFLARMPAQHPSSRLSRVLCCAVFVVDVKTMRTKPSSGQPLLHRRRS